MRFLIARQWYQLALIVLLAPGLGGCQETPKGSTNPVPAPSSWTLRKSGVESGFRWEFSTRTAEDGSTCMRFSVPAEKSREPFAQVEGCSRVQPGEPIHNTGRGRVPETPVAYLFGVVQPSTDAIAAEFDDGSVAGLVFLPAYVIVHEAGRRPLSIVARSKNRTVGRCSFSAPSEPC
jgi:hypothetical protein